MPLALQTTQGMVLAHAVANELRARRILLPAVALIEKMCAIALTRAEREAFRKRCLRDVVYADGGACKADRSGLAAKCCFHRRGVSSATLLAG